MPIISLSPEFLKIRSEKIEEIKKKREGKDYKKIVLIFKKEYRIDKDSIKNLANDLNFLSSKNLYDEIYIVKDDKIINESTIKKIYSAIKEKEKEVLKERIKILANITSKLIYLIKTIKEK